MMERSSRKLNNHYLHQKFDVLGLMYPARKVLANFQPLDMPEKDNQVVNLFSHSCVTETFTTEQFHPNSKRAIQIYLTRGTAIINTHK